MTANVHIASSGWAARRHGKLPGVFVIGICVPFIVSGVLKLSSPTEAAAEMAGLGLPWPLLAAWGTIFIQLGGSASAVLLKGLPSAVGAALLALFAVAATLLAHAFWDVEPAFRAAAINAFIEHISIICGLALVAWLKWHEGPQR